MEKLKKREKSLGFNLVSIEWKGLLKKARLIVREKKASFPVLLDGSRFSRNALYVAVTPTILIVDGEGRIQCRLLGYMKDLERVVESVLERI